MTQGEQNDELTMCIDVFFQLHKRLKNGLLASEDSPVYKVVSLIDKSVKAKNNRVFLVMSKWT
jgi:hypothetical protein